MQKLNGMHGNMLHLNQMLLVPVARETLADATLHAEAGVAGMSDMHLPGGRIVHKVKDGENLWVIAQHYPCDRQLHTRTGTSSRPNMCCTRATAW